MIKTKYDSPDGYRDDFYCCHCKNLVEYTNAMGTRHRNHCNMCLWSMHVDDLKSGDRNAQCKAGMKPIGFTFKNEGFDKYGRPRQGELMLIHECSECMKISINRIASDDNTDEILKIFSSSQNMENEKRKILKNENIEIITDADKEKFMIQIFGKKF